MTVSLGQTVLYNVITPVRLVATSNVAGTYANGPANNGVGATLTVAASSLTIDSVVVAVGDRVLLQNQTSAYQNGIYIVKLIASTVVLQRSDDQQTIEQLKAGQFTIVGAGTVNQGAAYALVEPLPQTIGVDTWFWVATSVNSGGLSNTLASGNLFVGNVSNVATGVPMSGDATMANTGALTIAANAITTAKILNANVTLAKLAAGIAPAYVVKFAGKDVSAGGSATVVITATGVAATDVVFADIQASANAVNIQKVTPTTNTITVLCSGDPGAATISYQALRAAA